MIKRLNIEEYFMIMAIHASSRASCLRRRVGCILVDDIRHVIATGYNGPPSGEPNCQDKPCSGVNSASGTDLHLCRAVHAEANAIKQCPNIFKIKFAYVTTLPCNSCLDLLLATSCEHIIYMQPYPKSDTINRWLTAGRKINSINDFVDSDSPLFDIAKLYGFEGVRDAHN